jgi:hypothetical protein
LKVYRQRLEKESEEHRMEELAANVDALASAVTTKPGEEGGSKTKRKQFERRVS